MNRYKYILRNCRLPIIWHQLVSWQTWNEVCDFVPKPVFKVGCYLDANGKVLEGNTSSDRLGLLVNGTIGDVLIKEGETISYALGKYFIHTENGYEPI